MNRGRKKYSPSVIIGVLLLIVIIIGCGIRFIGSAAFSDVEQNENADGSEKRKTVTVDGKDYFPRQDITVILAMGIDTLGEMKDSGSYNNDGEADVVALIVFDESEETFTILNLNRDTMVEMDVLGIGGKKAGTAFQQLALAHTYGSGMEDSCEHTKEVVSKLLTDILCLSEEELKKGVYYNKQRIKNSFFDARKNQFCKRFDDYVYNIKEPINREFYIKNTRNDRFKKTRGTK